MSGAGGIPADHGREEVNQRQATVLASHPDHCEVCQGSRRVVLREHYAPEVRLAVPAVFACPHCTDPRHLPVHHYFSPRSAS